MNYYLTQLNTLKLENTVLHFLLHNQATPILTNGIVGKIATMMYNKHIDYYYADTLATNLNVPIHHIDNIYLNGYSKCYAKPLNQLLQKAAAPPQLIQKAPQLEHEINMILQTRKPQKPIRRKFKQHHKPQQTTA